MSRLARPENQRRVLLVRLQGDAVPDEQPYMQVKKQSEVPAKQPGEIAARHQIGKLLDDKRPPGPRRGARARREQRGDRDDQALPVETGREPAEQVAEIWIARVRVTAFVGQQQAAELRVTPGGGGQDAVHERAVR
jgi:hypothetical protein